MVESVQQSLINIAISIVVLIQAIVMSMGLHNTCDNTWAISILKAIGIQCLAFIILLAVAAPMMYWDKTSRERSKSDKKTLVGTIGDAIGPWTTSGQIIHILLAVALYFFFTSTGC